MTALKTRKLLIPQERSTRIGSLPAQLDREGLRLVPLLLASRKGVVTNSAHRVLSEQRKSGRLILADFS